MELNANFEDRVLVHANDLPWLDSPIPGVQRRMLDRLGDEVARATTIVRYAPNSQFSPHVHTGGEEFVVLEGVFSDEHGDFPAGSYIRNPPQSRHTPGSESGCVIFVKLWQFDLADRTHVRTQIGKIGQIADPSRPGVNRTPLYQDDRESVCIEHWQPHSSINMETPDGAELLVLEGKFIESGDKLTKHSWLRLPCGGQLAATTHDEEVKVWIKSGHLRYVEPPTTN